MPDTFDFAPSVDFAHPELRLLMAQLDQATREWLDMIDGEVTPEELAWQPFPGGHSVAGLMAHIAGVEHYWLHFVAADQPFENLEPQIVGASINQMGVEWPTPPPDRPLTDYTRWLRETRERSYALIAPLDDPDRQITVTRRRDGSVHVYTLRWILTHTILHEAYHGGQAVLLLLQQRKAALS